jgi:MFS family permease
MRLRLALGSAVALSVSGIVTAIPGALLPTWGPLFDPGPRLAWYFNLSLFGTIVGLSLTRWLSARHPWFSASLLLAALGLSNLALARSFDAIVLGALPLGLAVGMINLNANALPGELYPERRMVVLSQVNAAFGAGAVVTPLLLALLPWRAVLLAFAAFACLGAFLVWRPPNGPVSERVAVSRSFWAWLLALVVLVYAGLEQSLATFGAAYLSARGLSKDFAGLLLSLYWFAFTMGRLLLSYFVVRAPLRNMSWLLLAVLPIALFLRVEAAWLLPLAGLLIGPAFSMFLSLGQGRMGNAAIALVLYSGAAGVNLIPAVVALLPIDWAPRALALLAALLIALVTAFQRADSVRA